MAIEVVLDGTIYTHAGIANAIRAFQELADVRLAEASGAWSVEVSAMTGAQSIDVARHFLNYALAVSIEERLR